MDDSSQKVPWGTFIFLLSWRKLLNIMHGPPQGEARRKTHHWLWKEGSSWTNPFLHVLLPRDRKQTCSEREVPSSCWRTPEDPVLLSRRYLKELPWDLVTEQDFSRCWTTLGFRQELLENNSCWASSKLQVQTHTQWIQRLAVFFFHKDLTVCSSVRRSHTNESLQYSIVSAIIEECWGWVNSL